jgi:hypothetical protein
VVDYTIRSYHGSQAVISLTLLSRGSGDKSHIAENAGRNQSTNSGVLEIPVFILFIVRQCQVRGNELPLFKTFPGPSPRYERK